MIDRQPPKLKVADSNSAWVTTSRPRPLTSWRTEHRCFWSWQLWELILVEHYIEKTLNEGSAEPRTNRESEEERNAEQR